MCWSFHCFILCVFSWNFFSFPSPKTVFSHVQILMIVVTLHNMHDYATKSNNSRRKPIFRFCVEHLYLLQEERCQTEQIQQTKLASLSFYIGCKIEEYRDWKKVT